MSDTRSDRVIIHIDMDAFYCSVDRERYPHWRRSPICVVQNGTLVVSSNYYARCRGYPKMGPVDLYKNIPNIMYSGSNMHRYREKSRLWYQYLKSYSTQVIVQKKSIDEALIDVTELVKYRIQHNIVKYLIKHTAPHIHYNYHKQRHITAEQVWRAGEIGADERCIESSGRLDVAVYVSRSTDPITASGINLYRPPTSREKSIFTVPANIAAMTSDELAIYERHVHPIDYVRCSMNQVDVCDTVDSELYYGTVDSEHIGSTNNQWYGTVVMNDIQPIDNNDVSDTTATNTTSSSSSDYMLMIGSQIAYELRCQLFDAMGLTTSAGIAHNPMLAKIASSHHKPNQQSIVRHSISRQYIAQYELAKVPYFGPKAQSIVLANQLCTVQQVQSFTLKQLQSTYGTEFGQWLYNIGDAVDHTLVESTGPPKSIGQSKRQATTTLQQKCELLQWCATNLTARINEDTMIYDRRPSTLVLTWCHGTWKSISRRCDLPVLHSDTDINHSSESPASIIFDLAVQLLKKHAPAGKLLMLSLTATNFVPLDHVASIHTFMKSGNSNGSTNNHTDNNKIYRQHNDTISSNINKSSKVRQGINQFFVKKSTDANNAPQSTTTNNDIQSIHHLHNDQHTLINSIDNDDSELGISIIYDDSVHLQNGNDDNNDAIDLSDDNDEQNEIDDFFAENEQRNSIDDNNDINNVIISPSSLTLESARSIYELRGNVPTVDQALNVYSFNIPPIDTYTCDICHQLIGNSSRSEHTDYHVALDIQSQIRRDDRIAREQQQADKLKRKTKSTSTTNNNITKSNTNNNTLHKFMSNATSSDNTISSNTITTNNNKKTNLHSFFNSAS